MLRKYLEEITTVLTGSDGDMKRKLNKSLRAQGLYGEGKTDKRVWVVKTHYPERKGSVEFNAQKCILLVRDPIDAIVSLFNLNATSTHNFSISNKDWGKHMDIFEDFLEREIEIWVKFHEYWMASNLRIPVYIVKYEDLLTNPKDTLTGLMSYLLNCEEPELKGSLVEKLLQSVLEKYQGSTPQVYKPRSAKIFKGREYLTTHQYGEVKR